MSSLRHVCRGCGGCCHGAIVRIFSEEEATRVRDAARVLGVDNPIIDDHLRFDGGRCAFIDDKMRCRIHGELGSTVKPSVCQQFPMVVIETESGRREGIDPGCYTSLSSWRTGPELPVGDWPPRKVRYEPGRAQAEAAVVALLDRPGMTTAVALQMLAAPGFEARWLARLETAGLSRFHAVSDAGVFFHHAMAHVYRTIDRLDATDPPPWTLSEERDAFAIDATSRMLHLRLASDFPHPAGLALLVLGGVLLAEWAQVNDNTFGAILGAWVRGLRRTVFWGAITPDPGALTELVG
jgi:Fe-S-cluster containining protein